ncbi:uncharacterized protein LOC113793522 [Dermatophagoides pteronyssinus]|uniref:uncharacterized protein LOC113793522 n=1 Tax=Dermatophagoides pteronyssinus TaxID=6956 RepID=UPI003F67A9A2
MVTVGTFIAFYWLKIFSNGERTEHMLRPLMRSNRKYRIFFTKKKSTRNYRVEDVESMRSFCRQANLVYIMFQIISTLFPIIIFIFMLIDFYFGYYRIFNNRISYFLLIRRLIYDVTFTYHVWIVFKFVSGYIQFIYQSNSWFRLEYKKLSLRYQPTRLRNNKKRLNINFMTTFIQKLTQINHEVVDLSNEMSMMSFVVYGFYLFALDVELFLLIDGRSQLFFRLVLLNVFAVTIFFAVMIFTTLANLNQYSRQMIPIVRYYLHDYGEKVTLKPNLLDKYRLIELDHQFNDDLIGHDCARMFVFTRFTNLMMVIEFTLNLLMIINLFQHYF